MTDPDKADQRSVRIMLVLAAVCIVLYAVFSLTGGIETSYYRR